MIVVMIVSGPCVNKMLNHWKNSWNICDAISIDAEWDSQIGESESVIDSYINKFPYFFLADHVKSLYKAKKNRIEKAKFELIFAKFMIIFFLTYISPLENPHTFHSQILSSTKIFIYIELTLYKWIEVYDNRIIYSYPVIRTTRSI